MGNYKYQILCSTGALLGRSNNRDYTLLDTFFEKLNCDGYEFMIYEAWYQDIKKLLTFAKKSTLNIPVIHCQKSLAENFGGMKVWREGNTYPEYIMTPAEEKAAVTKGIEEFKVNLEVAKEFGADRMVLHLWNGMPSDKRIEKNIEYFGKLDELAKDSGVNLCVENVLCNCHNPLYNFKLLKEAYPDINFVYDTKMAEFHGQTLDIFKEEWKWILTEKHIKHLHINDYDGGYMEWGNFNVLPIGNGHVKFDSFFEDLFKFGYEGDYTIEATALDENTGKIDFDMLNKCFEDLRRLIG